MSLFWNIVNGLNDFLKDSLEASTEVSVDKDNTLLEDAWRKQLSYSTDEEINRYLSKNGLYYTIEENSRYKCEKILIDYFIDRNIDVYRI